MTGEGITKTLHGLITCGLCEFDDPEITLSKLTPEKRIVISSTDWNLIEKDSSNVLRVLLSYQHILDLIDSTAALRILQNNLFIFYNELSKRKLHSYHF